MAASGKFCFLVRWFDERAELEREYSLYYYLDDNTIELFDRKNKRTFLKRCVYPSLQLKDLFVGAHVTVYARKLRVVGYGDSFTKESLEKKKQRALALLFPSQFERFGQLLASVEAAGFTFGNVRMVRLSAAQSAELTGLDVADELVQQLSSGNAIAVEVVGESKAWAAASQELGIYSNPVEPEQQLQYVFENPAMRTTALLKGTTCCIIRPHAVQEGLLGQIVHAILEEGFEVTAMELFTLSRAAAAEFLEVYNTVVADYNAMVEHLASGPCVALEVRGGDGEDAVTTFREFVGPSDPEIAKMIRPHTLRAQFGADRVQNALHCTDLPDDGQLETEYFFSILQDEKFKAAAK